MPFAEVDIQTQEVTYLYSDLTGSVVAKTSSSGILLGKTDYSPYGEPTSTALSRFDYAGEWTDEITGYSFLRARWLDTKTGSFLSEDPLVQMTQNAFCYTEGNPLTQIDPLGLWSVSSADSWSFASGAFGTAGIIVGLVAVTVLSGGSAAPAALAIASVLGVFSTATSAVATGISCTNGDEFGCASNATATGLSFIPFGASRITKTAWGAIGKQEARHVVESARALAKLQWFGMKYTRNTLRCYSAKNSRRNFKRKNYR